MTAALALIQLRDELTAYFAAADRQVEIVFGFGSRKAHALATARIAIEPGDGDGPRRALHAGVIDPTRLSEDDEAAFGQLNERFQLYLYAHDASAPNDVAAQCLAVRILHDVVCEAIRASKLSVTLDGASWVVSSEITQRGAGIVLRGYATVTMYSDTLGQYTAVTPWAALTRVHSRDEHVEDITSPPQEPPA